MLGRLKFNLDTLVNEMLDALPQDKLINGTVFDPSIGGGQFIKEVIRRKREAGKTEEEILNTVYGLEENNLRLGYAINKYDLVGNLSVGNYLELTHNMKFDIIIGNPPFQKNDNEAMRWTLWELFVKKSLQIADMVAMVTPQSITSPGPFNIIKDKALVINVDVTKHFNVGSTFCYFVADTTKKVKRTKIITSTKTYTKDVSNVPFLPLVINDETLAQIDYLVARPSRTWKRGELHTSNKELFVKDGKYSVMHTNAQELSTNTEHENKSKVRVSVSLSGYPTFRVIKDAYVSQACFWTEFKTMKEAKAFAEECNGEQIQKILAVFKWSGWNSKEVIQCL
jgi:tRNA1(Val) A37 N6-methylase TrmN6